jgi:hypothetical protein
MLSQAKYSLWSGAKASPVEPYRPWRIDGFGLAAGEVCGRKMLQGSERRKVNAAFTGHSRPLCH